MVTPITYRTL